MSEVARVVLILVAVLAALAALAGCSAGAPDAEFAASTTTGTAPVTISFSDLSSGDVSAWAWDFDGDMQIDTTERNTQYTYFTAGTYTVTLRATGQGGADLETKQDYITVLPPANTITGIHPNTGSRGQPIHLAVSGAAFTETSTLSLGDDITIGDVTVESPTYLTANATIGTAASLGPRDVVVTLASGSSVLPGGFLVAVPDAPTITGVSPGSADQAAVLDIVITGTNLELVNDVNLGEAIAVSGFTIDSAAQITASVVVVDTAPATLRAVSVANSGGTGTLEDAFRVTIPSSPLITGTGPMFGSRGQVLNVTIFGESFWGTSDVAFRSGTGVTLDYFTVDSGNQITAAIYIDYGAIIGPRDVSVTTPGGTATLIRGFEVVGVTPAMGSQGQVLDVVVTGNELAGTSSVSFGEGISVNSFTVDGPTQLTATVAIARTAIPGSRDISISTADGTSREVGSFTVSAPTCTAAFVSDRTTGNGVTTVKFTDRSTGDITSWAWDLNGDGRVDSTAQHPTFTYRNNGAYTVTLTVSGQFCEDSTTKVGLIRISGCST